MAKKKDQIRSEVMIYRTKNGEIVFKGDVKKETIWASLQQIAELFETDKSGVSRHIHNIYNSGELVAEATVAKNATVQAEGRRQVGREIKYYNLDLILSVGYRVNSKTATKFRQWATKTLRTHITEGYTINPKRIGHNYQGFLKAVEDVKKLLPANNEVKAEDALELIKLFAGTWFSLDAYDKSSLPKKGLNREKIELTADKLVEAVAKLKNELMAKGETSQLFAQEKQKGSLAGIVGSIFQSVFGEDAYPSLEEKAAHLLYFVVKNHPFNDGNKRTGAFSFVWFLNKAGLLQRDKISPEALTVLTLLVAESAPKEKERMVGLILQLLIAPQALSPLE